MEIMDHPLRDLLPLLTSRDRCDHAACQAQAYVSVLMRFEHKHPMLFCGHHWRVLSPAIVAQHPYAIRDELHLLEQSEAR